MPAAPLDTHELVVLSLLTEGPLYGYAIAQRAAARSSGDVNLTPGVLYPLLKRLEKSGLILGEWDEVKSDRAEEDAPGRRRKWYRMTPKGAKRLDAQADAHRAHAKMVEAFLPATEGRP
jgi:PadR family transcriptional regulator PadR